MNQIEKALKIAFKAHAGQVDKAGNPYILHPLTVAMNKVLDTNEQKIVAILHDVIEDSDITFKDLENMEFNEEIITALRLLTKDNNTVYFHYIREIRRSCNPNAYWVKYADLEHNMDIARIPEPTEKDYMRLEKYKKAMDILVGNIE